MINERQIQTAVMDCWRKIGVSGTLVAAVPNAGAMGQPGLHRGMFDLVVIGGIVLGDRTAWLELKTEKGKLSPAQEDFKRLLTLTGAPHAVAYGLEQAIDVLRSWRVIKPFI